MNRPSVVVAVVVPRSFAVRMFDVFYFFRRLNFTFSGPSTIVSDSFCLRNLRSREYAATAASSASNDSLTDAISSSGRKKALLISFHSSVHSDARPCGIGKSSEITISPMYDPEVECRNSPNGEESRFF